MNTQPEFFITRKGNESPVITESDTRFKNFIPPEIDDHIGDEMNRSSNHGVRANLSVSFKLQKTADLRRRHYLRGPLQLFLILKVRRYSATLHYSANLNSALLGHLLVEEYFLYT